MRFSEKIIEDVPAAEYTIGETSTYLKREDIPCSV